MDEAIKTIILAAIGSVTTIALAYIAARYRITTKNYDNNKSNDDSSNIP
jgi:hypothetical protein